MSLEEFVQRIAKRLGIPGDVARPHARTVLKRSGQIAEPITSAILRGQPGGGRLPAGRPARMIAIGLDVARIA